MLMNFCDPVLKPNVVCDKVSTDEYEVTNLISANISERKRGFLAYYAIRAPVTVTFSFYSSVNLHHISIWPQVGQQRSIRFEIYSSTTRSECEFHKIGQGAIKETDQGIIFSRNSISSAVSNGFTHEFLVKPKAGYFALCDVIHIQVKITFASSVPALAKVEIWGTPSRSCSKDISLTLTNLWRSLYHVEENKDSNFEVQQCNKNEIEQREPEFEFPEEFLDAITYEVMVSPMLLPCGKVVDQTTLDKHKHFEALCGRCPNDPFTGVPFNSARHPVPATSLKARLDMFLMQHSSREDVSNLPRTVGRMHRKSVSFGLYSECIGVGLNASGENHENFNSYKQHTNVMLPKRKLPENELDSINRTASLEDAEKDSLDAALSLALQGCPTFLQKRQKVSNVPCCIECKKTDTLFKLPCFHILCRSCLIIETRNSEPKCNFCKKSFQPCNPIRVHI